MRKCHSCKRKAVYKVILLDNSSSIDQCNKCIFYYKYNGMPKENIIPITTMKFKKRTEYWFIDNVPLTKFFLQMDKNYVIRIAFGPWATTITETSDGTSYLPKGKSFFIRYENLKKKNRKILKLKGK